MRNTHICRCLDLSRKYTKNSPKEIVEFLGFNGQLKHNCKSWKDIVSFEFFENVFLFSDFQKVHFAKLQKRCIVCKALFISAVQSVLLKGARSSKRAENWKMQ